MFTIPKDAPFADSMWMNCHTHLAKNDEWSIYSVLYGCESVTQSVYSVGIHPWHITEKWGEQLRQLRESLKTKSLMPIAFGEIGLDEYCDIPVSLQREVFTAQLEIAEEFHLPVVLHAVKSFDEITKVIKERKKIPQWVFHWYSGSIEQMRQLAKLNCFFSFGKEIVVGHKNRVSVLKETPIEKVLFETDDWEESVSRVYQASATHLKYDIDELKKQISKNMLSAFSIDYSR